MTNKEFDKWIAENIMGWHSIGLHWVDRNRIWKGYADEIVAGTHYDNEWNPTESISDAFQVVEKMRTTCFKWFEMAHRPNGFICNFSGDPKHTEFAETAPLAICLAAKKAVEADNKDGGEK